MDLLHPLQVHQLPGQEAAALDVIKELVVLEVLGVAAQQGAQQVQTEPKILAAVVVVHGLVLQLVAAVVLVL
jgi:SpoU rRNA methylase family enzyme